MPLPNWATERSKAKIVETRDDRVLKEQFAKTREKEARDELSTGSASFVVSNHSDEMNMAIEHQYEGGTLNYHGYTYT